MAIFCQNKSSTSIIAHKLSNRMNTGCYTNCTDPRQRAIVEPSTVAPKQQIFVQRPSKRSTIDDTRAARRAGLGEGGAGGRAGSRAAQQRSSSHSGHAAMFLYSWRTRQSAYFRRRRRGFDMGVPFEADGRPASVRSELDGWR